MSELLHDKSRPLIHVGIISWSGKKVRAQHIASCLAATLCQVSVVYSNSRDNIWSGAGNWLQVPDDWYYGRKFEHFLKLETDPDLYVLVQADATCDNWSNLIERLVEAYNYNPDLGVWVPTILGTPYKPRYIDMWTLSDFNCNQVTLVDGITWAFTRVVANRLRQFQYKPNNLGWGIEGAAVSFCYTQNLTVSRSLMTEVCHLQGAGYSGVEARRQELAFLNQLTSDEAVWHRRLLKIHKVMAFCGIKLERFPAIGEIARFFMSTWIRFSLGRNKSI